MYPIKIKEKYDAKNLDNLWHRFSVVYLWSYKKDDYNEWSWSHPGVDIVPETKNQDVFAVIDWVVFKSWEDWAYWKYIFLEHKNVPNPENFSSQTTLYSCYQHLSEIFVNTWDIVKEWYIIWKTWNTWNSFWEHLHFQIDKKEAPFHAYWPFTWMEVKEAWVSFTQWVNIWLWLEKAKMYTVNPLVYLDKIEELKNNKPKQDEEIIKKEELIINNPEENLVVSLDIKDLINEPKKEETIQPVEIKKEEIIKKEELIINDPNKDIIVSLDVDNLINKSEIQEKKNFKDIKETDKYFEYINNLAEKWILTWFEDNTFKPNNSITRSEFLKLLFLIKWVSLSKDNTNYFVDIINNSWQKKYINTWVNLWLISTNKKKFNPNSFLTKVEAIKMAIILFVWDINLVYSQELLDVVWNEWYAKYVEYTVNNDLLPVINNCFYPNKNITRYEVVEILYKLSWK